MPGGKMRFGQNIKKTIKREIKEKTSLNIKVEKINSAFAVTNPPELKTKDNFHFIFIDCLCRANSNQVKLNPEYDRFKWVSPQKALNMDLLPYSKKAVKKYLQNLKKQDYLQGWLRCKADFTNYQKKTESLLTQASENSAFAVILEILPVLDNFNLAQSHIPASQKQKSWVTGILYIKKQFEDILEKQGITEIPALGKKFNPEFHECIQQVKIPKKNRTHSPKIRSGQIIEVVQKGYRRGDRILRAAKVKIAK
ncbi:MAG: nucleotide exchange factor GrpE [Patescibacteria group bacterium]